jgi:diacylglycerol kinase
MTMNKPNGGGLGRIIKATDCSRKGFIAAWTHEAAFRQETVLALLMLPLSFGLAQSTTHWAMLVAALLLVLIVELLNSAIETLTEAMRIIQALPETQALPEPSARACADCDYFTEGNNCQKWGAPVPIEAQADGCDQWVLCIPF